MNSVTRYLPGIAMGLATVIGLPAAATAQQLWNIEQVTAQPVPPIVVDGVAVRAAAAGAPTAEAATVQVAFDYLHIGMGYLELPLPDGSMIAVENAVFEDRGDGNLMWTGEVPEAGYESAVFTVQDGHLVGWFGEPGGPKYTVYAGPDGSGSLAVEVRPKGDWCGVEAGVGRHGTVAPSADRSVSVTSQSNDSRLDILLLYPAQTEKIWRTLGGTAVGVQQLADYLNMVFRNGAIPAVANLIPVRWDPKISNHPWTQGRHFETSSFFSWHLEFQNSADIATLLRRYRPDLVHFLPDVPNRQFSGLATRREDLQPRVLFALSNLSLGIFAHEVGHNLGGDHEPASFGAAFPEVQASSFRPYIFGHTDMTSCSEREGWGDVPVCPTTAISLGVDAGRAGLQAAFEPYYSSARHKPNGWTMGVAGTSDVERLFHETVPAAVRSGEDAPHGFERSPRSLSARWTGRDSVRVTWSERSLHHARVEFASREGANNTYTANSSNVTRILEADRSLAGADVSGLRPGGSYRMSVLRLGGSSGGSDDVVQPLYSDMFHLEPPRRASGAPAAASHVGAQVTGPTAVRLHWHDNSHVEAGYEVWYRKWSYDEQDEVWRRYGEPLPASTRHVAVRGLVAEEEVSQVTLYLGARIGRYSFVVVAFNDRGWSASEAFHLEFMPGPYPEPTARGGTPDCVERRTGLNLDGYAVLACLETPDGARRRAWDYRLEANQSGLLYFFDRDNVEILVKVLNGCAINGHRWVFVAPVTTLPFRLQIFAPHPLPLPGTPPRDRVLLRSEIWYYDSKRRPQEQVVWGGNPKDRTARTVSDTTAFPCTTAEIAAAKTSSGNASDQKFASLGNPLIASESSIGSLSAGSTTDCEPGGPALTLRDGYAVSMCYETYKGEVGDARDWGLDSSQSGLLYFFERNNAEVLIKVLDGCGVNGHRWVFVAPVTDLAFNLRIESPDGQDWIRANRLGQTAEAWSDVSAFPCSEA